MQELINRVEQFLKKYDLQDKTLIVGFSGGYDSMCLLDVLTKISKTIEFINLKIVAAHFNHNWRGEEALKEQEVCRLFALSKGVEFYTKTATGDIKKTENDARIARYDFFEDAIDEYDAHGVLTAHNFDDNAETLLYRIAKGTGTVGLKGIQEKRDYFYRPLLHTKRSEILEYCTINNLSPNNDSSNADVKYKRNYLRLNVLPSLEKINPNVKEALNTLSIICNNENQIIDEFLAPLKAKMIKEDKIDPEIYKTCSKPVKLRVIHEFLQSLDLDYDYKKIVEIYDFIEENITLRNGATKSLATALWLYADVKTIEVIPPKKRIGLDDKSHLIVNVNGIGVYNYLDQKFSLTKYADQNVCIYPSATSNYAYVDLSNVKFPLELRTRNEGDLISPFGMTGSMKLKKFLNSKGIPRHNRDNVLLLCDGDEVLWCVGVGISNKIAVKHKPTHVIEVLCEERCQ